MGMGLGVGLRLRVGFGRDGGGLRFGDRGGDRGLFWLRLRGHLHLHLAVGQRAAVNPARNERPPRSGGSPQRAAAWHPPCYFRSDLYTCQNWKI